MATLEVHDGQGRVQRVAISRDQTVLFGSSPKCDIVLSGDGVMPFHGRLRWKSSRYKIDASPDARFLMINGQKMAASSFRQGDEVAVGPCRIYMIHADEDLPRDDKTRVQPAPLQSAPAQSPASRRPRPKGEQPFEQVGWMKDLEVIGPSVEMEAPAPPAPQSAPREVLRRGRHGRSRGESERENDPDFDRVPTAAAKPGPEREKAGFLRRFLPRGAAPGQERILTSPLVFALAIALAILVALGVMLNTIIARSVSSRLYLRAVESLEDGDYRNAIRRFDEYLARRNGEASKVSQARVHRAMANVRQFTSATGASWSNALVAEREMLERVGKEPAYRDSSTELAELVVKTGESLADRARKEADPRALAEAEDAVALHARVAGASSGVFLARSKLPARLEEARAAVRKAAVRSAALAAMDSALKASSSAKVYAARDALVRQYADLAADRELVARMTRANDLIRGAVTFDASRQPALTEPVDDGLGPPASLVLRAPGSAPDAPAELPVLALADGFAYGLDAASGAPRWQLALGLASPFTPLAIPGGTAALGFDVRNNELVRIDRRTGSPVWRQPLGEPVIDAPLVLGNQVIQATPSGKVVLLDLASGEVRGTYVLGLPLSRTPVSDESGQFLYVLADKDCLFVLKRDPPGCAGVEYLGHAPGSLQAAPARLGKFLVVAENHELAEGRWRVFVLDDEGAKPRPVQQVPGTGWTWETPASSGSVLWATGDRGGLAAYATGAYEGKAPLNLIARLAADAKSSGPSFALARTERELWLSGWHPGRYDLDVTKGTLTRAWTLGGAGPALAPIQVAGPLVVMTHQPVDRPGVALWGLDPQTGAARWQTVLGSAWPSELAATAGDDELTTLGSDGQVLRLTRTLLESGGFVESVLPGPGDFRLPAESVVRLDGEGPTVLAPRSKVRHLLVRTEKGTFRRVDLPVALGASPLRWGRDVLIPGDDGRAYLIDPATGESRAEPFVPPFDREHPTHWLAPVRLDDDAVALADESGKVRRLTLVTTPKPRLESAAEASLGSALIADPTSTGGAIVLATADGKVRSLSARDLSPVGAWPLEAPLAGVPFAVAGRAFVSDREGGIHAFGPDGQRLWSTTLRGTATTGPPVVQEGSAWFLARDGSLHRLALDDGAALDRIDLKLLPAGAPRTIGPDLVIPAARGTLRLLNPRKESGEKPASVP